MKFTWFRSLMSAMMFKTMPFYSPIYGLPLELLSEIFLLACEADLELLLHQWRQAHNGELSWRDGPPCRQALTISHVSRHFRDVAIRTASLWTVIYARDGEPCPLNPLARLCLKRSKKSLLDVYISPSYLSLAHLEAYARDSIQLPKPLESIGSTDRWRSLHIHVLHEDCMVDISEAVSVGPTPCLRHIEILCEKPAWLENARRSVEVLSVGKVPQLTSLTMDGLRMDWSPTLLCTLQVLVLTTPGQEYDQIQRFLEMLRHTPLLRKLVFTGNFNTWRTFADDMPPTVASVELTFLEHLTLGRLCPGSLFLILSSLSAPAVQHLVLPYWGDGDLRIGAFSYDKLVALVTLIRFPSLKNLRLDRIMLAFDESIVFGRHFTALEELELACTDRMFTHLMCDCRDEISDIPKPQDIAMDAGETTDTRNGTRASETMDMEPTPPAMFPALKRLKLSDVDNVAAICLSEWLVDRVHRRGMQGPSVVLLDQSSMRVGSISEIRDILQAKCPEVKVEYYNMEPSPRSRHTSGQDGATW